METKKFCLTEKQMPTQWYNIVADMPNKPLPPLHPGTKKPAVYSLVNNGLVAGIRFQLYTHGAALIVHESQRAPPPSLYVEIANHILFGKYNGSDP